MISIRYVTEKFWMRANQNLLPIVMGSANYTKVAPPHSYINVFDYKSPKVKKLMKYEPNIAYT